MNKAIHTNDVIMSRAKKYMVLLHPEGEEEMALALKLELCYIVYRKIIALSVDIDKFAIRALEDNDWIIIDTESINEGLDHFQFNLHTEFQATQFELIQLQKDRKAEKIAVFETMLDIDIYLNNVDNASAS